MDDVNGKRDEGCEWGMGNGNGKLEMGKGNWKRMIAWGRASIMKMGWEFERGHEEWVLKMEKVKCEWGTGTMKL